VSISSIFQKQKRQLLDVVKQLHACAQKQQSVFTEGTEEDIARYIDSKKDLSGQLDRVVADVQHTAKSAAAQDRSAVSVQLKDITRELQPLMEEIVRIEQKDREWLSRVKDRIQEEMKSVQDAKQKLMDLNNSYGGRSAARPQIIDSEG